MHFTICYYQNLPAMALAATVTYGQRGEWRIAPGAIMPSWLIAVSCIWSIYFFGGSATALLWAIIVATVNWLPHILPKLQQHFRVLKIKAKKEIRSTTPFTFKPWRYVTDEQITTPHLLASKGWWMVNQTDFNAVHLATFSWLSL